MVLAAPWHLGPGPLMPTTRANKQRMEREQYTTGAPGTPGVQQTLTFPPIIHLVRSQAHLSTQACLRISCWQMLSRSHIQDAFPHIHVGFHTNYEAFQVFYPELLAEDGARIQRNNLTFLKSHSR